MSSLIQTTAASPGFQRPCGIFGVIGPKGAIGFVSTPMKFPYNRGWEAQPNGRGLYTHYKDSVIKGGMSLSPI